MLPQFVSILVSAIDQGEKDGRVGAKVALHLLFLLSVSVTSPYGESHRLRYPTLIVKSKLTLHSSIIASPYRTKVNSRRMIMLRLLSAVCRTLPCSSMEYSSSSTIRNSLCQFRCCQGSLCPDSTAWCDSID